MFQAIETTEARTVWVDSRAPEFGMGFLKATRVEVVLNPDGVSDWKEPGSAYQCTLMSGLWPDKHEIALMVLGYSPGSTEANEFLAELIPSGTAIPADIDNPMPDIIVAGTKYLLQGVRVMPVWDQARTRMVFVTGAFMRGTAKDDAPNLNRTGPGAQRPTEMAFDHWKLMLDLRLKTTGITMSDGLVDDDWITDEDLRNWHDNDTSIEDTIIEITQRIKGSKPVDVEPDVDN